MLNRFALSPLVFDQELLIDFSPTSNSAPTVPPFLPSELYNFSTQSPPSTLPSYSPSLSPFSSDQELLVNYSSNFKFRVCCPSVPPLSTLQSSHLPPLLLAILLRQRRIILESFPSLTPRIPEPQKFHILDPYTILDSDILLLLRLNPSQTCNFSSIFLIPILSFF